MELINFTTRHASVKIPLAEHQTTVPAGLVDIWIGSYVFIKVIIFNFSSNLLAIDKKAQAGCFTVTIVTDHNMVPTARLKCRFGKNADGVMWECMTEPEIKLVFF